MYDIFCIENGQSVGWPIKDKKQALDKATRLTKQQGKTYIAVAQGTAASRYLINKERTKH